MSWKTEMEDKAMSSCSRVTRHNSKARPAVEQNTQTNEPVFIDVCDNSTKQIQPIVDVKEERSPTPEAILTADTQKDDKVKLQCSECSRVYYSAEAMASHMRRHRGENPFQCVMCDYTAYNKTVFMEHVNGHLGIKPYRCSKCDYSSVSKKYLKVHEERHATCEQCGHVAPNINKLNQHCLINDCGVSKNEKVKHKCVDCDQHFSSRKTYLGHVNSHKPCPHCGIQLAPRLLTRHLADHHGVKRTVDKKKFKCKNCDYEANGLAKILLHLIHHPQQVNDSIDVTPLVKCGILSAKS